MGGNDLLVAYGDARAARRAITTVNDNGRLVLGGLRALMGADAPIVVATVYDPSDGSGDAGRLGLPPWPEALALLAELNRVLWCWPSSTGRWWRRCTPGSSATVWPLATLPSRPPAPAIVACGTAA
jgi:hypothetical protein